MRTIAIVVNKNWETEPFLNAMTSSLLKPKTWPFPTMNDSPKDANNRMNTPRAIYYVPSGDNLLRVSVWCIQDLMSPDKSASSFEEKYRVLPKVITAENPELVIAVGTAGSVDANSLNGCIVAGSQFFLHNGHPGNKESNLQTDKWDKLLPSNINPHLFHILNKVNGLIEGKLTTPPKNPALVLSCHFDVSNTALATVNITNYLEYTAADPKTLASFKKNCPGVPAGSVETTHAIIKLSTDKPIIFFSGITDRLGYFDEEVTPLQNYTAAFNTGICVAYFLDAINELIGLDSDFSCSKS